MASARVDIISIGSLARNLLWNESDIVRTAHSTTSLIQSGKRRILVDPGLPPAAIGARLHERTGLLPDAIDIIFLTSFHQSNRAGLSLFPKATLLLHENEQEFAKKKLLSLIEQAPEEDIDRAHFVAELKLLKSMKPADDKIAPGVDLFPLFGYTPGTCGLIVSAPTTTLLITGDAVASQDHFLNGQTLPDAQDIQAALESMREVYEIADLIVPGRDNLFVNPRTHGM